MLTKTFYSIDKYLSTKTIREIFMIYILSLGLVFFIIYFWILPPINTTLKEHKKIYKQTELAFKANLANSKKLSHTLEKSSSKEILLQNQSLTQDIETLKKLSKSNYDLLENITTLTKNLNLKIISDIQADQKSIKFTLIGDFENIMEWIRNLEENHFVFIQDFHFLLKNNKLTCQITIKNLGL
ncbi:hypothetical protein [Helicobacter sp. 11S03491-1]|uniref:hypothetical protein n=1 Tax=Helicobacter sp. 11S03491-1 TaxID=1476196 RepID=UPI000BA68553|nr:hypothetical protein [Helicobacter sp. 11S03491-1]PAF41163.1 hypothetical protein BKH45_08015 [Helicobacter sp. 11S03491-1]